MRWLLEHLRPRRGWGCVRVATRSVSRVSSAFNCCTSVSLETAAMIGGLATSSILSAMCASLPRSVVPSAEARIIRTLAGRRWRKSSLRKAFCSGVSPRWSPSSCCTRRSSCLGFLSPSSSPLISCCSFRCSEAAVRLISFEHVVGRVRWGSKQEISDFTCYLW